ncbi:unnamed protein product [Effrenium voratum]|nr:unnamed protein product [Effrenium voratum]
MDGPYMTVISVSLTTFGARLGELQQTDACCCASRPQSTEPDRGREVHYDDAQLCRALRALAKELRSRLGVWSSQASEEVLERIEETLLTSTEKEKATPAEDLRGFHGEGQMCVSPAAPPPSCVEIPAGSDDEAPRAADPMAFGKYPMHAEVKAFQRQSQQTEALRREVASLRKALETSATDFQQMAEDAATSAAQNAESLLRSAERGLTEKFQAAVDHALDQREHLSFLARDAVEDRLRRELRAYSEVTDESLEALRGSLAQKSQKWEQEAGVAMRQSRPYMAEEATATPSQHGCLHRPGAAH